MRWLKLKRKHNWPKSIAAWQAAKKNMPASGKKGSRTPARRSRRADPPGAPAPCVSWQSASAPPLCSPPSPTTKRPTAAPTTANPKPRPVRSPEMKNPTPACCHWSPAGRAESPAGSLPRWKAATAPAAATPCAPLCLGQMMGWYPSSASSWAWRGPTSPVTTCSSPALPVCWPAPVRWRWASGSRCRVHASCMNTRSRSKPKRSSMPPRKSRKNWRSSTSPRACQRTRRAKWLPT